LRTCTQLERVQRKFLHFASYILKIHRPPHDYTSVITALGLSSLAERRHNAGLRLLGCLKDY